MGGSSDKSQQNQQAQQQIGQNTEQAKAAFMQYLQANPSILQGAKPPQGPQQFGGVQGGGVANAPQMGMPPKPPMAGQPAPGGAPPGGQPQLPPGLLALLSRMPQ